MTGNISFPRFKAAAVQSGPVLKNAPDWFDLKASVDKTVSLIMEAGRHGARLVVFPEGWLPCFTYWGFDFTALPAYRDLWAAYLWNSIEVPGPEIDVLAKAAASAGVYVTLGINERDKDFQGRMYNSVLYLGPDGKMLGIHRKICNTFGERLFHTPGDGGDNLKAVFKTDIGNLGGSICGEHLQLTLMYNWIMQGIQVHCSLWPGTATTKTESDIATRAFCRTAHAFGILSSGYFREQDLPENFYKNAAFNIPGLICGGSGIVNPWGEYIAGPVYNEETIVYGDIDLAEMDKARFAVNLTGAYSRWDLINLNVQGETYQPFNRRGEAGRGETDASSARIAELEMRVKELEEEIAGLRKEKG